MVNAYKRLLMTRFMRDREQHIDLRSDTVTRPCTSMLKAMTTASVGDDVWGDDPSVKALEAEVAIRLGKEDAIYVASGTQSNLVALLSHCQRGDEYICGNDYHTYKYEAGGASALGGIHPRIIPVEQDGSIPISAIDNAVRPDDVHFARSRLLSLENTVYGKVISVAYLQEACAMARAHQLNTHLDGARLYNAAVALGIDIAELAKPFDSISLCLSKGLGAPVGSVLSGSKEFIKVARRWRKMVGGGMRQAGFLAAAGIYALKHNIERLAEDHANARALGLALAELPEIEINIQQVQTNMVFFKLKQGDHKALAMKLAQDNILVDPEETIRLVTHLDIKVEDIGIIVRAIKDFVSKS
jgi:threonine aldolase